MATKKTRAQLQSESDATFLDNSTGQIIPENHRIYNDNVGESAAILKNPNIFEEENTFYRTIISDVAVDENALSSEEGYIVLTNGGLQIGGPSTFSQTIQSDVADDTNALSSNYGNIYLQNGDLDVGGQTNLNSTFIRVLQNGFKSTAITASGTIDLSTADGNLIYIEGDTTIDSFIGKVGQIFYALFTGTCLLDHSIGNIQPPATFTIYPNDVLILLFTATDKIRVLGIYRSTDEPNVQLNGQNYFQINLPQDALNLALNNSLAVGATYKVLGAYEVGKTSGIFYDVYLRAKTPQLYESTCYLSHDYYSNGVLQKALFFGNFDESSIQICDRLDAANIIDYTSAGANSGSSQFAIGGSKVYVRDSNYNFWGDAYYADASARIQRDNLLNIEYEQTRFGRMMNVPDLGVEKFISNSGYGYGGIYYFGNIWYDTPLPTVGEINIFFALAIGSGTTTLTNYRVSYSVVNDICTLNFWASMTASYAYGASGREAWILLPTPFFIANDTYFSTGTCRNNTGNHADQGLQATNYVSAGNNKYFKISSKFSSQSNNQALIISGSITFQVSV